MEENIMKKILSALCAIVLGVNSIPILTFANSLEVKAVTVDSEEEYTVGNSESNSEDSTGKYWSKNINYTLKNGVLTFSGKGELDTNYSAIKNKDNIKEIIVGNGITSLDDDIFYNYKNLMKVTIADTVTFIGTYAFSGCTSLKEINLPDGVTSIGDSTFYNCINLKKIIIPKSATYIGFDAFNGCSSLTEVIISDKVTSIDNFAFENCSSLSEIILPENVTSIGLWSFYGCTSLKEITIKNKSCIINNGDFTINEDTTIIGYANSTAYDYAVKYNRRFVDIETNKVKSAISGDVNGDNKVDSRDAVVVLKDFASQILGNKSTLDLSVADMNDDGKINSSDAVIILKQYAQSLISK
jgi:hypothetical protein